MKAHIHTTSASLAALFLVLGAGIPASLSGQGSHPASDAPVPRSGTIWVAASALSPARVVLPDHFDPEASHTLVLGIHGFASSAERFSSLGRYMARENFIFVFPQAPYPYLWQGELGFDWTLIHREDPALMERAARLLILEQLPEVVRTVKDRYRVDRVFALGFSQGASVAILTAIHNRDMFDGVVSFGLPILQSEWFQDDALEEGSDLPVLLVHGRQDGRAPILGSERAEVLLEDAGYDVDFRRFNGGHTVPRELLPWVMDWMLRR